MPDSETRVSIAYISRTKGVRGKVKAQPLTDDLRRFNAVSQVVLQKDGRPDRPLQLESWSAEGPSVLLKFSGIDSPEGARDTLVKGYVTVSRDEVPALPRDTYYIFELVGCQVEDENGRPLGSIAEVLEMPSTDVYVVRGESGEILIPAVADYIADVTIAERRMLVRGIKELLP